MASQERLEAIKALSQLATMYHMSSPDSSRQADPAALRLRNRAAVLQLATHANISEEEAADAYQKQQGVLELQRRREAEHDRLRNLTHGGVPYNNDLIGISSPYGGGGLSSSPLSASANRRHYMSRRLDGGSPINASFGGGSPSGGGLLVSGGGGGASPYGDGAVYPPPPLRRDSAIGAVESLVTLANSYAATGRFTDAVRVVKRAIAFAENQFKPKDTADGHHRSGSASRFKKSNTQTSQFSNSAPTVSSIYETPEKDKNGSPSRRVGFAGGDKLNTFNVEVMKGIHDTNASFSSIDGDADAALLHGAYSSRFDDNTTYINQPQLVPLLVLLSTFLDAEGSRHEAQCLRDRVRNITENIQGIGMAAAGGRRMTSVEDDVDAMQTVLTPIGAQFDAREELLELASPEHRRRVAEELLRQRTGTASNDGGRMTSQSLISSNYSTRLHDTLVSSPSRSARGTTPGRGDASPGSVAYVRNRNFYKY